MVMAGKPFEYEIKVTNISKNRLEGIVVTESSSSNLKLGDCSATYASQHSCPTDCPFLGCGCYAEYGPLGWHTERLNQAPAFSPIALARQEDDRGKAAAFQSRVFPTRIEGLRADGVPVRYLLSSNIGEVMTMFLAGHETTANALGWTWFLLAQNPAAEQKLLDELNTVVGNRSPDVNDVPKLHYTEAVLKEAMRLYPPA
jgi:hypothetical protein